MKIINPATEELSRKLTEDTQQILAKKFQLLQAAQPAWQKTTVDRTD